MIFGIISGVIALVAIGLCIWNHTRIKKLENFRPDIPDIALKGEARYGDSKYGDSHYG